MIWQLVGVMALLPVLILEVNLHYLRQKTPSDYGREVQRKFKVFVTPEQERAALRDITRYFRLASLMYVTAAAGMLTLPVFAPDVLENIFVMVGLALWGMVATALALYPYEKYKPPHAKN